MKENTKTYHLRTMTDADRPAVAELI